MRRQIIAVRENQDVWSLARTLIENGITGAPVLDGAGALVGVISQTDLVRYLRDAARDREDFYSDPEQDLGKRPRPVLARDLMTRKVIQADEEASLAELSRIMLRLGVHRVLITSGRRLSGIVTTMDILRARSLPYSS